MIFENKTIILTGASSGIGKALAGNLVKEKCRLILIARRKDILEKFAAENKNHNAEVFVYQCDVSNKEDVTKTFSEIITKFGKIDIAVLNAGTGQNVSVENYDSKYADEIFGVNVLGMIYCVEQLLPGLIKQRAGMIVGVSSLADNRGYSGSGFYCASKAAATIYLEGLRVELKKYGVKVITVKPGFVKTPMTDKNDFDMPLIMHADKAANIILNGIKKEKRIIQFPLPISLSAKVIGLMPSWMYEFIAGFRKQ